MLAGDGSIRRKIQNIDRPTFKRRGVNVAWIHYSEVRSPAWYVGNDLGTAPRGFPRAEIWSYFAHVLRSCTTLLGGLGNQEAAHATRRSKTSDRKADK